MNTATTESSEIPRPGEGIGGRFVMIAEDDVELRGLLVDTLVEDGCVVRTAADGRELLAMLSAVSRREMPMPSLIVMDVRMPRCSGMDVLTALRLAAWEVPVVIMTAFGDGELHANARALRAAIVLDKPFELDTLRCVVRRLCLPPATPRRSNDYDQDEEVTFVPERCPKGQRS